MTQLALVHTGNLNFAPATQVDREGLERAALPVGGLLTAPFRKVRNGKHHRLVFAMLWFAFHNQEKYATMEDLRQAITLETSFCTVIEKIGGGQYRIPRSWSYAEMDEEDFNLLHAEVVDVLLGSLFQNQTPEWLADAVKQQAWVDGILSFS